MRMLLVLCMAMFGEMAAAQSLCDPKFDPRHTFREVREKMNCLVRENQSLREEVAKVRATPPAVHVHWIKRDIGAAECVRKAKAAIAKFDGAIPDTSEETWMFFFVRDRTVFFDCGPSRMFISVSGPEGVQNQQFLNRIVLAFD